MTRSTLTVMFAAFLTVGAVTAAAAQDADSDDAVLKPAEPDFTLSALPTGLRLPKYKSAFRVTHRFVRPLNQGDFGDLAGDLFGIDAGAQIGLEYRFGIIPRGQIGFNRTSNRDLELFAQYDVLPPGHLPLDISAWASLDNSNNFKGSHSPTFGAVVSKTFGAQAAVYVEPMYVNNSNPLPRQVVDHNDTFMIGLGTRIRVRPTVYVVAETAPRVAGYKPGVTQATFAVEKRAGGHMFQLNFGNAFGTTMVQIARGGPESKDWFMGFNISRKFF